MPRTPAHRAIASFLAVAMFWSFGAAVAAPSAATLTGTVYADDVKTPLAGATVVVTDSSGRTIASSPTGGDGAFKVAAIPPGTCSVALETADGRFPIATAVSLAPGQTRGVHVALKGSATDEDKKNKKKGAATLGESRGTGAMIAVLIGFVAAGAELINRGNDESQAPSPSQPGD